VKKFNLRAAVPGYFSMLLFLIIFLKKKVSIVMPINKIISLFVFFTGLLFLSCNPSEPENSPAGLEFAAEDASCTEAWIKLKADNIKVAQVFKEDSLIYSFNSSSIDTVLYDEGLLPNQTYKYKLAIQHPLANGNNTAVNKVLTEKGYHLWVKCVHSCFFTESKLCKLRIPQVKTIIQLHSKQQTYPAAHI